MVDKEYYLGYNPLSLTGEFMSVRIEKINSQMQRVVTQIIQEELDDPTIGLLSITRVETSSDLRESVIYFSVLDEKKVKYTGEVLAKMNRFIRGQVGKRMSLRFLPELKFVPDDSIRYSTYIYGKIEEARAGDSDHVENDDHKKNNRGDTKQ